MKILYHHRIRSKDGQYVHLEGLTDALKRLGHEVVIVGPPAVQREVFGADAGAVAWLKRWMPRPLYELLEFAYSAIDYTRLRGAVRKHRPDCIYERYNLFLPSGIWISKRFDLPMLLEVNAPLFEERLRHGGLALRRLAGWTESKTWRGAGCVLPVTGVLADYVHRAGVPRTRIQIVPNGIHRGQFANVPDRDQAKRRLGLEGRLVLGFTGFVRDWHGMDRAVDFISRHGDVRNLHLIVVGDGPARTNLERRAAEHGVSGRFTVTGIVDRDGLIAHLAAFDIALQPNVVAYASPLKLFEYLAMGLPVVAPETANICEILSDGETALLFDPDDPDAFERTLLRLCEGPALRRRLGTAGRKLIDDRGLTWDNNAKTIVRLFGRLGVVS